MKFLAKLLVLAFAAKTFMASPQHSASKKMNNVGDMTLRQLSHEAMSTFSMVEAKLSKLLS